MQQSSQVKQYCMMGNLQFANAVISWIARNWLSSFRGCAEWIRELFIALKLTSLLLEGGLCFHWQTRGILGKGWGLALLCLFGWISLLGAVELRAVTSMAARQNGVDGHHFQPVGLARCHAEHYRESAARESAIGFCVTPFRKTQMQDVNKGHRTCRGSNLNSLEPNLKLSIF